MELFDWQLKAGQRVTWTGAARYLRLVECIGTIVIDYDYEAPETDQFRTKMIRGVGVDLSHPISNKRAKNIGFTSPVDQTLTILISELPTTDSRLSGTVSVIDGTRAVVDADKAFSAMIANVAVVGNYSKVALWNPVGSGKVLLVRGLCVSVGGITAASVHKITAAISAASGNPVNKLFSSAVASVAQQQLAAVATANTTDYLWYANMAANAPFDVNLREYVELTPGTGILTQAGNVNIAVSMGVQYVEENQ